MRGGVSILLYLLMTVGVGEGRHIFLTPRVALARTVVVVILPEAGVDNSLYKQFGETIQKKSPYRTWSVLADLHGKAARLEDIPAIVWSVRDRLREEGLNGGAYDLFLAGHGTSGFPVQLYASIYPAEVDGILLYNSYLRQGQMVTFPVPILTISGDLDGVNRITHIADMLIDNINVGDGNDEESLLQRSPIVVLEGVNHGSLITGELPENLKMADVYSDLPIDRAIDTISQITSTFLVKTVDQDSSSMSSLLKASRKTLTLLQPIMDIKRMTLDSTLKSTWVTYAQIWLSGILGPDSAKIHVQSYVNRNLEPALMEQLDGSVTIFTFSEMVYSDDGVRDDDMPPATPKLLEIKSKLFNAQRLQTVLSNTSGNGNIKTCRDINYASFVYTYNSAQNITRKRFDETHSGIMFHDDIVARSKPEWEQQPLVVEHRDNVLHVTSVSWTSPIPAEGIVYCKLLPPPRIVEWMYVDSLL
ncbi:uncharacterized protein LOC110465078 [Mizuhopecten yessoensis]|uniref:Alpha/beta hydrolase fold-5 domain-containing protein n=1 Tax=Mizuhopecten yessoensis TaxID=6573 RepID=A0A210PSG5_MIZYE|nr:uncharacterized protein LOC110465078 [Mizuhopecten yessoensis]OWF39404.1 hypothetical protein KP79_PYT18576 [Mizuhopecten yessoensis]